MIALLKQLTGRDPLAIGKTAKSRRSEGLTARTKTADRVVQSICPYCAVGCGQKVYVKDEKVIHIEGDPDSPINGGTLCPKGASTLQLAVNQNRVLKPKVRKPGSADWEDIEWSEALDRLARHMKDARDKKLVLKDKDGQEVNRNEGFGFVGGATITSEEGYLTAKFFRALGCVYLEQQARV